MKLIELPNSPFWGGNIHVGYSVDGKKRYSPRSSKVVRDPSRVNDRGQREDKAEAMAILTALQNIANQAMASESAVIERREYEEMVSGLLRAIGKPLAASAPSWGAFSTEVIERQCRDLAKASVRSYWSKKAGFDSWLEKQSGIGINSPLTDFKLAHVQSYYDWRIAEGGQSTTANGAIKALSLVFEQAVVADFIAKNPCKGIKKRDNVMIPRSPFTLADLSAISRVLVEKAHLIEHSDEWSLAVRFAIVTGAREGDCVSLRWSDFADDFKSVRFIPSKKDRLHRLGKVDASISLILPDFVSAAFRAARLSSDSEMVTPSLASIHSGKRGLGPRFREIMELAGVKVVDRAAKGKLGNSQASHSFHSFRHTTKSFLEAAGVSRETNNRITGHEDDKVAGRYIHADSEAIFRECAPVFAEFEAALKA